MQPRIGQDQQGDVVTVRAVLPEVGVRDGPFNSDLLLGEGVAGVLVDPGDGDEAVGPTVGDGEDEPFGEKSAPALVVWSSSQLHLPGVGSEGRHLAADDSGAALRVPGDRTAAARLRRKFGEAAAPFAERPGAGGVEDEQREVHFGENAFGEVHGDFFIPTSPGRDYYARQKRTGIHTWLFIS